MPLFKEDRTLDKAENRVRRVGKRWPQVGFEC